MAFGEDFDRILAPYLVEERKDRLKQALLQFTTDNQGKEIDYTKFYKSFGHAYFMQADLLREIRMSNWNEQDSTFHKVYPEAIIVSNTCDISADNSHKAHPKQCLFAPIMDFSAFAANLAKEGYADEKLEQFVRTVKAQLVSNLFYLPVVNSEKKEYIVLLDRIFWFPADELNSYIDKIQDNRITSLSHFGYYLFILKLSYHLCRLPEQCDREVFK